MPGRSSPKLGFRSLRKRMEREREHVCVWGGSVDLYTMTDFILGCECWDVCWDGTPPPPDLGPESPYCLHPFLLSEASTCSSLLFRVKQAFLKHSSSPKSQGLSPCCLEDTSKHLSGILSPLCYDCSPRHAVLPVFSHAQIYALSLSLTAPLPCLSGCQSLPAS